MNADLLQFTDQFARLMHVQKDIATPDEFAREVNLRKGRPITKSIESRTNERTRALLTCRFSSFAEVGHLRECSSIENHIRADSRFAGQHWRIRIEERPVRL